MVSHDHRHPSHQAALRGVKERGSKICSLFLSPLPSTLSCWAPLFAAPCRSRPKWAQFWASVTALTWKDCMSFSPGSSPCRPASSPSLRLSVVSAPIFPKRSRTTQRAVTWTMEDSCPSPTFPRNSCKNPGTGVQPHTPCKTPLWLAVQKAQLFLVLHFFQAPLWLLFLTRYHMNWSFDIAQQCTHTSMIANDLSGQSDLARASDSQHYFTWTTWFLQSTSSRAQRRQASAPWAPPCSTPSFYQAFQISWIDRALQYQLTFNKPTAQPSCCKGAFLLQRPYGFFVLCFTEIARFVVVKRPRCAKGHRHPAARFLAFGATSTLTAPVTQNLRISTSAADFIWRPIEPFCTSGPDYDKLCHRTRTIGTSASTNWQLLARVHPPWSPFRAAVSKCPWQIHITSSIARCAYTLPPLRRPIFAVYDRRRLDGSI